MKTSRRKFLSKTALSVGGAGFLATSANAGVLSSETNERLPREVWIASLTQHELKGNSVREIIGSAVKAIETVAAYKPDIVCLPEAFHVQGLPKRPSYAESAEEPIGHLTSPLAEVAKKIRSYVIASIYTVEKGNYYNAAVLIDRDGKLAGVYKKIRPTEGEIIQRGLCPGPVDPPVFETDFGKIGIQICFDIEWLEGWTKLKEKGAEMVFWPSAFGGGKKINHMAWLNQYPVISSTRKGITKICDVTGESITESGLYSRWGVCAPINLEKAVIHSWPYAYRFPDIHAKYGNKVRTYTLHEEEISILESRSPEIKVADVMKEFDIISYDENKRRAEVEQEKRWAKM